MDKKELRKMRKRNRRVIVKKRKPILPLKFITIFLLISVLVYFFFFSPLLKINKIIIIGGDEEISIRVKTILGNNIGKNIILFSANKESKQIKEKIISIEEIKIKKKFFHTLIVVVKKSLPVAYIKNGKRKFLLNKKGIIYEQIDSIPKDISLIEIGDKGENRDIRIGEKILDKEKINNLVIVRNNFRKMLPSEEIVEFFIMNNSMDFEALTKSGWKIYFSFGEKINVNLAKLRLLLFQVITPSELRKLDYIDLRFSKAYYKLKK